MARRSAIRSSVIATEPFRARRRKGFFMPAFERGGHPGPWIAPIRKRGDCPREQAAGNGGGNRRQDGNDEARQHYSFRIGTDIGESNAL
jgi:hypothetical protein